MKHDARAWSNDALEMLGYPDLHVRIEFNSRFTSKMGDACYKTPVGPRIRLSAPMWPLISAAMRRDTVIHEICHIVVSHEANNSGKEPKHHGPEWKSKMRACGLEPKRCHEFDISKVPGSRRKMKAYCMCGSPHMFTKRTYNKILAGAIYRCKKCKASCTIEPRTTVPKKTNPEREAKPANRTVGLEVHERLRDWLRKAKDK